LWGVLLGLVVLVGLPRFGGWFFFFFWALCFCVVVGMWVLSASPLFSSCVGSPFGVFFLGWLFFFFFSFLCSLFFLLVCLVGLVGSVCWRVGFPWSGMVFGFFCVRVFLLFFGSFVCFSRAPWRVFVCFGFVCLFVSFFAWGGSFLSFVLFFSFG